MEAELLQNYSTSTMRVFNHSNIQKLYSLHKSLVYNSQSVYMEYTQTTDPIDSLYSGQPVCMEFPRATRLFCGDAVYLITVRFPTVRSTKTPLSSESRHCCDYFSHTLTFNNIEPATTLSTQRPRQATAFQHSSQQVNMHNSTTQY